MKRAESYRPSEALVGLPPNRMEALADGIFAVAMTILVLELHVPELGPGATDERLLPALESLAPKALSFASGFVILGTLWIGHHFQFRHIERSTRAALDQSRFPPRRSMRGPVLTVALVSLPAWVRTLRPWLPRSRQRRDEAVELGAGARPRVAEGTPE